MTFKRHHLEADLTEADYDFLLPLADPITPTLHRSRRDRQVSGASAAIDAATAAPSACATTFGILELAEAIFLHLPPETLLCKVQRVCRQWRRFVQSDELVQQYLFLKPIHLEARSLKKKARVASKHPSSDVVCKDIEELWANGCPDIENPWLFLLSAGFHDLHCHPPQSSWKRMLLSQSPRDYVYFDAVRARRTHKESQDRPFLTLGDLRHVSNLDSIHF